MSLEDVDTSRTRVQTYVPAYQKAEWERHASELDMSLSEFVRSMVQAGRRGFPGDEPPTASDQPVADPSSPSDPQGSDLEERVLGALSEDAYLDWDELLAEVTGDIEDRVDRTLQDLQDDGTIRYSGRHGGYTIA